MSTAGADGSGKAAYATSTTRPAPVKRSVSWAREAGPSQEYQAAFDRFIAGQGQKASTLGQLAGLGLTSSGRAGDNLTQGARYAGDVGVDVSRLAGGLRTDAARYEGDARMTTADRMAQNSIEGTARAGELRTGAAAAKAGGVVGGTNAWTQALSNGVRAATDAVTLGDTVAKDLLEQGAGPLLAHV